MKRDSNYLLNYDEILTRNRTQTGKVIRALDRTDKLIQIYEYGYPFGESCGIRNLDRIFSWVPGFVYCFTGYPGSGKSEILYYLAVLRATEKNIKIAGYFPEIEQDELIETLTRMYIGKNTNPRFPAQCTADEYTSGLQ